MSSQVWRSVYHTIRMVNRSIPREGRRPTFPDTLIVAMYLWATFHDRPMCWAADRLNYSSCFRPRRLPSRSQFCRRIKSRRCNAILRAVFDRLGRSDDSGGGSLRLMDGRALRVQSHSKDPEATRGWASGGFARGYKLHALVNENERFLDIRVRSLNVSEKTVARELIDANRHVGFLLADQGYESGSLYDYAAARGMTMMTPLKANAGKGHRPQSKARLHAKKLWRTHGRKLYDRRNAIERYFGQLSAFGGGLAPLPPWVRRLERVERWVLAKVILSHARLATKETAA